MDRQPTLSRVTACEAGAPAKEGPARFKLTCVSACDGLTRTRAAVSSRRGPANAASISMPLKSPIVTKVDSGAITSVLELLANRNVLPQRMLAQRLDVRRTCRQIIHIEIYLARLDLTMDALRLIAAKIVLLPTTLSTVIGDGKRTNAGVCGESESSE
jgi:hypothetical protein